MRIIFFTLVLLVSASVNAQWDSIRPRFYVKPSFQQGTNFTISSPYNLWDRSNYSPLNQELGTLTDHGTASFETTFGLNGSAGFNLPIRKSDSKWLQQIGLVIGNTGTVHGFASGSYSDRSTVDSVMVQSTGEQLPVDSVTQTIIRSSYILDFEFVGLEYNFLYRKSERALIGFGLQVGYLFGNYYKVETVKIRSITYEPKVKPDEPDAFESGKYDAYVKSSLFNLSLPVSVSILLNDPKRASRFFHSEYIYAGLQFKPSYLVGGFNNTMVSRLSMQFNLSLNYLFSYKSWKKPSKKKYPTD